MGGHLIWSFTTASRFALAPDMGGSGGRAELSYRCRGLALEDSVLGFTVLGTRSQRHNSRARRGVPGPCHVASTGPTRPGVGGRTGGLFSSLARRESLLEYPC